MDILVDAENFIRLDEIGYSIAASRSSRVAYLYSPLDTTIRVWCSGVYAGSNTPTPVRLPPPDDDQTIEADGYRYLKLHRFIEIKLASGMNAAYRIGDFADALDLIRDNQLPFQFGQQLHPHVRSEWNKHWHLAQIKPREM